MRMKRQTPGMVQASDARTASAKSRALHRELHGENLSKETLCVCCVVFLAFKLVIFLRI